MPQLITPKVAGPAIKAAELERAYGPCVGAVMGYGEGELGEDGRLQWCASVLPRDAMTRFLQRRMRAEKTAGRDGSSPFLIAMGSLKRAIERGGVGEALFGIALAAPYNELAKNLLHPHHLNRPENLDKSGQFRWPNGVPLLRVWLATPPVAFAALVGSPHRRFNNSDGNRVVPLDELVPGLAEAIGGASLREAVLDRPAPLSPVLAKLDRKWREGFLRYSTHKDPVRSAAVVRLAMEANEQRFGGYQCEDCGYRPADDPKIAQADHRGMLDVHHLVGIGEGERETTLSDLLVLCPTCHRREHVKTG